MFIGIVGRGLLKEIFSKEAIAHISKFCVMSRSKPDFAKVIPNACESSLSNQQNESQFLFLFFH